MTSTVQSSIERSPKIDVALDFSKLPARARRRSTPHGAPPAPPEVAPAAPPAASVHGTCGIPGKNDSGSTHPSLARWMGS